MKKGQTVFYVRALRGGKVGRIFRVIPGQDACFHCLTLYHKEGKTLIDVPSDPQFPTLKNECNNPIRPASAADLKLIASFGTQILIDHLQNADSKFNHWIWSTETIEGTPIEAYQAHQQTITPHKDCFYCNPPIKKEVSIDQSSITFMQSLVTQNPEIETGGVLAGFIDSNGNYTVTHVSGPGPNSIQTSIKFQKDAVFCQKFLDYLFGESRGKIVYIGEWHSHPNLNNNPSMTDIKSLGTIAIQKEYLITAPIMIIFSNKGEPSTTIHPANEPFYYTTLNVCSIENTSSA